MFFYIFFRAQCSSSAAINNEEQQTVLRQRREEIAFNLETFMCVLAALAEFDDWRLNLGNLLQPMPFPDECVH